MGFTLVPPNMMRGGLKHFLPVDAMDGANMRDRAAGTMLLRATKDADDHLHPISTSVMLGGENTMVLLGVHDAECQLLDKGALDEPGRVCLIDGGRALESTQLAKHPESYVYRCEQHMKHDLAKRDKDSLEKYNVLCKIPHGRADLADVHYDSLKAGT